MKITHPTSELMASLNLHHEDRLLREFFDTNSRSSIIFEAFTSEKVIRNEKANKPTWITVGGQFSGSKSGLMTFLLSGFSLKQQISWMFHMDKQ
jgi:hypothetical protein